VDANLEHFTFEGDLSCIRYASSAVLDIMLEPDIILVILSSVEVSSTNIPTGCISSTFRCIVPNSFEKFVWETCPHESLRTVSIDMGRQLLPSQLEKDLFSTFEEGSQRQRAIVKR